MRAGLWGRLGESAGPGLEPHAGGGGAVPAALRPRAASFPLGRSGEACPATIREAWTTGCPRSNANTGLEDEYGFSKYSVLGATRISGRSGRRSNKLFDFAFRSAARALPAPSYRFSNSGFEVLSGDLRFRSIKPPS